MTLFCFLPLNPVAAQPALSHVWQQWGPLAYGSLTLSASGSCLTPRAGLPPGWVGRSPRAGTPQAWPSALVACLWALGEFRWCPLQCLQRNCWISTQESTSLRIFYLVSQEAFTCGRACPADFFLVPFPQQEPEQCQTWVGVGVGVLVISAQAEVEGKLWPGWVAVGQVFPQPWGHSHFLIS